MKNQSTSLYYKIDADSYDEIKLVKLEIYM